MHQSLYCTPVFDKTDLLSFFFGETRTQGFSAQAGLELMIGFRERGMMDPLHQVSADSLMWWIDHVPVTEATLCHRLVHAEQQQGANE